MFADCFVFILACELDLAQPSKFLGLLCIELVIPGLCVAQAALAGKPVTSCIAAA
jgi:hypothetical protein